MRSRSLFLAALSVVVLAVAGCSGADAGDEPRPLVLGGIPDQDVRVLEERFGGIAEALTERVGIPFEYRPATSYAAVVTAFQNGDVLLGWFGGLTGVQARLAVPGAEAVAQRPIDQDFRSVFIVGQDVEAETLTDLAGLRFTFGSESSTSGHLMPRHFLRQEGLDPDEDFDGRPGYSGSHDKTWKLVEAGSFEAGALNAAVWDAAVEAGEVDTGRVRALTQTPPYVDYHWVLHPDVDERYGEGTSERIIEALLSMSAEDGAVVAEALALFETDRFIPAHDDDYAQIETVARDLGLIARE
ncbi:MAG: putative selenate ABC transporter substrate-binding protein [Actinobacteria bacterium]|nr:putative selenate ABC transporter substrate-binding protein [Actinomycetota bacterium]